MKLRFQTKWSYRCHDIATLSYHQHADFDRNEGHRSVWLKEPTDKERRTLLLNSVTKSQNFSLPSSR